MKAPIAESNNYQREYVDELVKDQSSRLCVLSAIAEKQPQADYLAFVNDFKNRWSYFMRTIISINSKWGVSNSHFSWRC